MHDFTNLLWPEAPFGAAQRPCARPSAILAAIAFDWAPDTAGESIPAAAAIVYLRIRRDGKPLEVTDDTLELGFRISAIQSSDEVPALLNIADRALSRARRHAKVLAGHRLSSELEQITAHGQGPLRGMAGTLSAWPNRGTRTNGIARMVDTGIEAADSPAKLHLPNAEPPADPSPDDDPFRTQDLIYSTLTRCLAVGMTAAYYLDRYRWAGTFRTGHAIKQVGWDVLAPFLPRG